MNHVDAALHTRGESEYVDDMPLPSGMLYGAAFTSPLARGRIKSLNTAKAEALEGVETVLTAADIPGRNRIGPIIQDETLLADGQVFFVGQPVALVVADNPETASKAAGLIEIRIEELPAIVDPREAFAAGEIIGEPRTFSLGDVESAWARCSLIVEGSCDIGGQEHVYLETQRARAVPLEGGSLRIHASTQGPYASQKAASTILGIPMHRIEVEVRRLGGGFGGKEDQATPWACLSALAAWTTGKPVEIVLSRADDMKITGKRHPYRSDFKIGVDGQGRILAYQSRHYQNSGAFADLSTAVLERTLFHGTNSYSIPNVEIFAACCRTNLPPNTAFRGFGGPQGMFVIESAIARVAEELGVPPEEIQEKNLLQDGDTFPYGQIAEECRSRSTWREAVDGYGLPAIRKGIEAFNEAHFETKKGLAVMPVCFGISFTAIPKNQAGALIHVYTDGSVSVSTGGVEMGQGLSTNIAVIVARALGIGAGRVKIESTSTARVANMSPSAASATTLLNGNAALRAAQQILGRLKETAARELGGADPEQVSVADERVLLKGAETGWDWKKLVSAAYLARVDLSSHGFFSTPEIWFDKGREKGSPFAYHAYGTAIVEVTLDCLRGVYDIDAVRIVHDLGRPLNEKVDLGQIEGGLAQGLGWMTLEDLRFGSDGRLLSSALATYKVPDVYFMPDVLEVRFLEDSYNRLGPFGSKAVGEPPLMYGIGAFFALRAAMRAFAEKDYDFSLPLTPERVLMELHREERKGESPPSRALLGARQR